jgi:hypothetical protein
VSYLTIWQKINTIVISTGLANQDQRRPVVERAVVLTSCAVFGPTVSLVGANARPIGSGCGTGFTLDANDR